MQRKASAIDAALNSLKSDIETIALPVAISPCKVPRPRKESVIYPQGGSPHRIHALHKKDGVVKLIQGWSARVGDICPYISPSAVQEIVAYTHDNGNSPKRSHTAFTSKSPAKGSRIHQIASTKLPSPSRPAWDSSAPTSTSSAKSKVSCNLQIILHNHTLALTHRKEKLPLTPKYLSKIVIPNSAPVYGLRMETPAEKAMHFDRGLNESIAKHWRLQIHPLHGINLIDPCRKRKAHVCSRQLRPFVEVRIQEKALRCKPSFSVGPSPVWSRGWLSFDIHCKDGMDGKDFKPEDGFPAEFHVRVLNKCGDNDMVVGATNVSLTFVENNQGCDFHLLRDRRGHPTGQIKLLFHLSPIQEIRQIKQEPDSSTLIERVLPPRAKLLFGDELRMVKSTLRHIEASHVVVVQGPTSSVEEAQTLYETLLKQIHNNSQVQLFKSITIENPVVLGEGIHANVMEILLHDKKYAMKEFRYNPQVLSNGDTLPPFAVLRQFQQEFNILSTVHHDNIVQLFGVQLSPRIAFITEYMDNGSVHTCRQKSSLWSQLNFVQIASIALQVACAISYLHQQNIIHRDIKSHNVLLSGLALGESIIPTAKLCDLGSAIVLKDTKPTEEVGTSGYMAPEVVNGQGYSFPSDIWSFGIFLWELMTPSRSSAKPELNPYVGLSSEAFMDQVTQGHRPKLPSNVPLPFRSLMNECWRLIPSERPTAEEIVIELTRQLNQ